MNTAAVTDSEEDFIRWMDEVDLEEVNLLDKQQKPPELDAFGRPVAPRSNQLEGAGKPQQLPTRDTGWKAD